MKIKNLLEKHNIESVFFLAQKQGEEKILYEIVTYRYDPKEEYKISLRPVHFNDRFGTEHFYIMDLESLIGEGYFKVLVEIS